MASAQFKIREITGVFRRRWIYLLASFVLVGGGCIIGAYNLTRKYESSTTILVKLDETLRPMAGYEVTMAFDEQLRNFSEILESRSVILALADSLGILQRVTTDADLQKMMEEIRGNISAQRLGSDSFRITYTDTDPARAKRGAEVATSLYIQTKIAFENRQNAQTVQFYEQKVAEYRQEFETTVRSVVSSLQQRVQDMPVESQALYGQVQETEKSMTAADNQIASYRSKQRVLSTLPEAMQASPEDFRREDGKSQLFELERSDLPYAPDLKALVLQYDQLTRRYRGKYPDVEKTEAQIIDLLKKMRVATDAEIARLEGQRTTLERQRSKTIEDLKKTSSAQKEGQDKESAYDIKKKLYDDMRSKLEEARLAQEVGSRGANQFIVLDPAVFPTVPTKPNRSMIIGAGFGFGLLLGIILSVVAELLDTRVRSPLDVEMYQKPIIAFLPDAHRK